jgi:hypothetical protein
MHPARLRANAFGVPDPKSVIRVFQAQPPAVQQQIIQRAWANPNVPVAKVILQHTQQQGISPVNPANPVLAMEKPLPGTALRGDVLSGAAHTVSQGLGDVASAIDTARQLGYAISPQLGGTPDSRIGAAGLVVPQDVARVVTHAPIDIARASIESPATIPKTVAGLGTQALAAGASLAELPIKAVQEGPGKALSQTAQGMAADYARRYGPLAAGNDRAFINRIKQQGAAPEVIDALGMIGGFDATAGRGITSLAKVREGITGESNFLTRTRPALRISGNETRDQALARGALKISAQRAEDQLRRIIHTPSRPGEVRPLFEGRAQRVLVSGIQATTRRNQQDTLQHEVRTGNGMQAALRKLSPWEQKAAGLVHEGWVPLRSGPDAAVKQLDAYRQMIVKDRQNPASPGNHIAPKDAGTVDTLRLIDDLKANTAKWLTPRLADFVDSEGARANRVEQLDQRGLTQSATARRLRAQGEMLGIKHPDQVAEGMQKEAASSEAQRVHDNRTATRASSSLKISPARRPTFGIALKAARAATKADKYTTGYEEARTGLLQDYINRIRAERPANWHEPAYMEHTMRPKENFGAYTQGSGQRAMPGYKQSRFDLWRGGAVYRTPQMMVDSLARGIKGQYHWPMVDELARRNGLPAPTADAIKAALGVNKGPAQLTGYEAARAYDHMGTDLRDYRFMNPGRLSELTLTDLGYFKGREKTFGSRAGYMPPEFEADSKLGAALSGDPQAVMDGREVFNALHSGRGLSSDNPFLKTHGWIAVPKAAFDEIHSGLRPSGLGARAVGKGMGLTAGLILGGSPSFVVMNTLAHAILTAFATRGRILTDAIKAPMWYHGLSTEERAIVDAQARGRGHYAVQKLGSTAPGALRDNWRAFQQSRVGRTAGHLNLITDLWKVEDAQSNFFRRVSYYSVTKQLAFENIGKELGFADQAMQRFMHSFDLGPKDQMAAVIRNQPLAEEAGRRVVNALGDYARFTHRERTIGRGVLFYSFLRHVIRNLFYVLPFKHPIATALVGALGQLHKDEVQKILGPNPAAWTYGRVFFDKNGKLTSIDMTRALPVGGLPTEVASQGVKGLASAIPPGLQPLVDMVEGQTVSGQKVPANAFSLLNGIASLSYPYRLAKDLHFGTQLQQPDSIPFIHQRPETRKSAAGQAYLQQKEQALGPLHDLVLASLLGLYPKPDDSAVIAQHAAQAASKASSSSGGWNFGGGSSGSSSSGVWNFGASSGTSSSGSGGSGWNFGG